MREPPDTRPLEAAIWRKASYSTPDNGCVEIARQFAAVVGIRDSKAPATGRLAVSPSAFDALLDIARCPSA